MSDRKPLNMAVITSRPYENFTKRRRLFRHIETAGKWPQLRAVYLSGSAKSTLWLQRLLYRFNRQRMWYFPLRRKWIVVCTRKKWTFYLPWTKTEKAELYRRCPFTAQECYWYNRNFQRSAKQSPGKVGVMAERELNRSERATIRKLVTELCANYDSQDKICLPLDSPCYMLNNGGPVLIAGTLKKRCCRWMQHWNQPLPARTPPWDRKYALCVERHIFLQPARHIVPLPAGSMQDGNPSGNANAGSGKTNHDMSAT